MTKFLIVAFTALCLLMPTHTADAKRRRKAKPRLPEPWSCMTIPDDVGDEYPDRCMYTSKGVACCAYQDDNCLLVLCRRECAGEWEVAKYQCLDPKAAPPKSDFDPRKS